MLTREEYFDACALQSQGWSISAIASHLGRDRKTVRSYLTGERLVGVRNTTQDDFLMFSQYCRQRLLDDPHMKAVALFDEVAELGYPGGYSTFTRALRKYDSRPSCKHCHRIIHGDGEPASQSAGGEVRFNWMMFPGPPAQWGYGSCVYVLVASLPGVPRWRAVLSENKEFPQLVEAVDKALRRLGGTRESWRFDQVPTVYCPTTGRATPEFSRVSDYYGATIDCRPCQGGQEGVTHQGLRSVLRFWWRSVRNDTGVHAAQGGLDHLAERMDGLPPWSPEANRAGPLLGAGLRELPAAPFPARICAVRSVTGQNLVTFRGNSYEVPFDLCGALVEVRWRLDEPYLSIVTARGAGIARHALAPPGAGLVVACAGTDVVLERPRHAVPRDSATCRTGSTPRPLSPAAQAEADALRGRTPRRPGGCDG